jgi:hypothetical protein
MNKLLNIIKETNTVDENLSSETNMFGKRSPVKCSILNLVAVIFLIFFIIGVVQNLYILIAFYCNKKLRSFYHKLIICITIINFAGLLTFYPIVIASKFKCRWIFDEIGCNISSFIVCFTASVIIIFMAAIAIQR